MTEPICDVCLSPFDRASVPNGVRRHTECSNRYALNFTFFNQRANEMGLDATLEAVREEVKREAQQKVAAELLRLKLNNSWSDDSVQFPRLLAEIAANCTLDGDWGDLCESMDCTTAQIDEIFDRAQNAWKKIKEQTCPPK